MIVPRIPARKRIMLEMIKALSQPRLQAYTSSRNQVVAFVPFRTKLKTVFPRIVELPASKYLGSVGRFFVLASGPREASQ